MSWLRKCQLGPLCTSAVTPQPLCCPRRECFSKDNWAAARGRKRGRKRIGQQYKKKTVAHYRHTTARVPIYQKTQKDTFQRGKSFGRELRKAEQHVILSSEGEDKAERELEVEELLDWPQRNPDPAELALLLLA